MFSLIQLVQLIGLFIRLHFTLIAISETKLNALNVFSFNIALICHNN